MRSLNQQHKDLLRNYITDLQAKIRVGTVSHNWTSLGIEEFIKDCKDEIDFLKDRANSVFKSEEKLKNIFKQISNASLTRELDCSKSGKRELMSFYNYYEEHRQRVITELLAKYDDITEIIKEIEKSSRESLKDTKDKDKSEMAGYYSYWEVCILNALTKTILKALITLNELFTMQRMKNDTNILFTIKAKHHTCKDILFNPNNEEIEDIISKKLIRNFLKSASDFIRWKNTTCDKPNIDLIETDELKEEFKNKYSYHKWIDNNTEIKNYASGLMSMVIGIKKEIDHNKDKYIKEYTNENFGNWVPSKSKMQRELEKNKSLRNFEAKLTASQNYLNKFVKNFPVMRYCTGNVLINNEDLIIKGVEQIGKVMNDLLKILATQVEEDMKKFINLINTYKEKLKEKITDTESLKNALNYISKIRNKKLSMELKMKEIDEKLHFLSLHNYIELGTLQENFEKYKKEWSNLRVKAARKDDKLEHKKRNLAEETKRGTEQLKQELDVIYKRFQENGPASEKTALNEGLRVLLAYNEELEKLKVRRNDITVCHKLFNLEITAFEQIKIMCDINDRVEPVYNFYREFTEIYDKQLNNPFGIVDENILKKLLDTFTDKIKEFRKMKIDNSIPFARLETLKEEFKEQLEFVMLPLKSPIINNDNFKRIMVEMGKGKYINFNTPLKDVIALDLIQQKEKLNGLVEDTKKENKIKEEISNISKELEGLNFQIKSYKRDEKTFIFKDVTDEMNLLQEKMEILQQKSSDKHAAACKEEIALLEQDVNLYMEVIDIWKEVQKKWMYLESIFIGSEDIRQKLPDEAKDFEDNDRKFRVLMSGVQKKPSIKYQCKTEKDRKFELKRFLAKFEQAERKLTEHLDSKKNEFSRFYFLTESDLLQILGSSDPLATINPHMIKMYENCKELTFEKRNMISGMKSQEGEYLRFEKEIRIEAQQQVGQWMNKVDEEMKSRVKALTREGIQDYTKEDLFKFIKTKLGMVIINTFECWWTFALEDVFQKVKDGNKNSMKDELKRQSTILDSLVVIVRRGDLTLQDRLKINNLIIRVVHGREIVDKFVRDSILDAREFEWESQLKFYWDKKRDELVIRQCSAELKSCYEYQGLQGRLVVTPLTDRCVMTLTTALNFYLGGAPAGPAGTGKTETVKDLGKGLGIRVVVQNCTNTLDYIFMGQFFSGLSQTGFWGCFDEFNRINREVLSVITTQIKSIQLSLSSGQESWILNTKEVKLLPTIGIFITMNPNYEGRSELPDNLKALFRPITMVTPDQLLICENLLLSEGFSDSKKLAGKIDKLYKLCKEQLSDQHHYDWSLRTVKAVLSAAGILKRENQTMAEDVILMKAMKNINMPRFIKDDSILFEGLIKDLFPSLDTSIEGSESLRELVKVVMKENKYKVIEAQVSKVMQMYEIMLIRHTSMICGPPVSGKSCILDTLRKTVERLNNTTIIQYLLNPKAQTIPRLYGKKNEISGDFEIGILANIFQIANAPLPIGSTKNETRWIILDGDIDPYWIENMNSVMDDSKCLTLENKDRILMQKYCAMILESSNIHHASLATISRLGIIYVDSSVLEDNAYFLRWLDMHHQPEYEWEDIVKENLQGLYDRCVPACLKYVLKGAKGLEEEGVPLETIIKQYPTSMVRQLCTLLDALLPKLNPPGETNQLEPVFAFCLVWSIGACLKTQEERDKFSKFIKDIPIGTTAIPTNLYDKCYNIDKVTFEDWDKITDIIPDHVDLKQNFNEIIIPTMDTKRYSFLLKKLLPRRKPCLFVGESGTGKTVTIQNYLKYITSKRAASEIKAEDKRDYLMLNMNFSSRTSSMDFQNSLEEVVETRSMRKVGPPSGKELLIYIDDLGMPRVDPYETQQPIAFLKLLMENKCFYSKDNKDLISLLDANYIGSTLPPGGGNNAIDHRFIALFSVFNITAEQDAVQTIFNNIFYDKLETYSEELDMGSFCHKLVKATSEVYKGIKDRLPRTPIKFHYIFNIRDISKVFQGVCQMTPDRYPDRPFILKLWRHECLRVFSDKLLSVQDKEVVNEILKSVVTKTFAEEAEFALTEPCLYGDFMKVSFEEPDEDTPKEVRFYENIESYDSAREVLEKALAAYIEKGYQPMDLVFYVDAVDHLLRIHRIIRIERGNCLLVGIGGSGKQSLAKLATFLAKYELWQLTITSKFEEKHFREQLVTLFKKFEKVGEVEPVVFLFTDEQVLNESFMELINNILTTGIVPAIFEKGDKENIIEAWKNEASRLDLPETKDVAYNLFVNKIRANLHMILAMSPSGNKLRIRSRDFPGLVSNTTIDWYFEWPYEALSAVSSNMLSNYKHIEEDFKATICEHMINVHLSVRGFSKEADITQKRKIYTTPKNFLDYIKSFKTLYENQFKNTVNQINRLAGGLEVLKQAASDITILRKDVQEKEEEASRNLVELTAIKESLEKSSKECEENTKQAKEKEMYLEKKAVEIDQQKTQIEIEVKKISELIELIEKDVENIGPKDIETYGLSKRFDNEIGMVLKALYFALLEKEIPKKWDEIQDPEIANFLLKTSSLMKRIRDIENTYLQVIVPRTEQAFAKIANVSVNEKNKSLVLIKNYIKNFSIYARQTYEKNEKSAQLERKIEEKKNAMEDLRVTKERLLYLQQEMQKLEILSAEKNRAYEIMDTTVKNLQITLVAATELFEGLKSEQVRWGIDKENLLIAKEKLIGDCLLSSAFLSYCGPFSFEFRRRMIYDVWTKDINEKQIKVSEKFTISNFLATESTISQWNLEGLPDDELSVQNGILTVNATRWPLCIDPEMQAISWIKQRERDSSGFKVVNFHMDFMKVIINAIKNGHSVLIENIDENIDPNINPVLEKNYRIKAFLPRIFLDGTWIEIDPAFKLFMTTKLSNPCYTPEIMAKTMVINYSVTMDGLEEQLLNEVVRFELPVLEEQRKKLVDEMSKSKITLNECEESLLKALSASRGTNILENQALILNLKNTKKIANEVKISLDHSETVKKEIYASRSNYIPVAKRGSILYFAMSALRLISSMYEYSLNSFMTVYKNALTLANKERHDTILSNRLENFKRKLTYLVYEYTCYSISSKHKLMFTFHMKTMIMRYEENLDNNEMLFFLKGNLFDAKAPKRLDWLSKTSWQDLDGLTTLNNTFRGLMNDVISNEGEWKAWFDLEKPEDCPLPCGYDSKLTNIQRLCLIRVFRQDRVYNEIKNFIRDTMGEHYLKPPSLDMDRIFSQGNERTPILFVISPGSDPYAMVERLAAEKGFAQNKFRYMSLGQKQEKEATEMILDGVKRGLWILLQNCDLLQAWLKDLENIIDKINNPKPDFRLWLTTSPIPDFPIGILQKSFKVVTEPPEGIALNIHNIYRNIKEGEQESKHPAYRPLIYTLSFFHSILQDRKKFGKIGWNVTYDFSDSDFQISKRLLSLYLDKVGPNEALPWNSLKYLIGEAMYGGRVTDDYDRRVMMTYLNEYMGDFIFDANQKFFFSTSGYEFSIPDNGPYDDYKKYIESLPTIYSPEVLGLHSNAEIDYFTQASKSIWSSLLVLQETVGSDSGDSGNSREATVSLFADELLKEKLPPAFDMIQVNRKFVTKNPIDSVLLQEIERYNVLNDKIRNSLIDLKKSFSGEIAMNSEMEDIMISLFNNILPIQWRKLAPETQKSLGTWVEHYQKRYHQYNQWLETGEPKVMWLSGLHVPASYLKAIIQTTCRKKCWPLDKVDTYTVVTKFFTPEEVAEKPEYGCYISGLYLEGAEWNIERNCLEKQQ
jgi:dynein heavy chain